MQSVQYLPQLRSQIVPRTMIVSHLGLGGAPEKCCKRSSEAKKEQCPLVYILRGLCSLKSPFQNLRLSLKQKDQSESPITRKCLNPVLNEKKKEIFFSGKRWMNTEPCCSQDHHKCPPPACQLHYYHLSD